MSPRSLRLLETSLVSAFVSFGVAAAALHAAERKPAPPQTVVVQECADAAGQDVLAPLLRTAVEADVAFGARAEGLDETEAFRVESLYAWYAKEHEALAGSSEVEWAKSRAASLRQLQDDLREMRKLEKAARALQEAEKEE